MVAMASMDRSILVGTAGGLWSLTGERATPVEVLAGRPVTALALDYERGERTAAPPLDPPTGEPGTGPRTWAVVDGRVLWEGRDGVWRPRASVEGQPATCVAATSDGPLLGTEQAHLLRLAGDRLERVESFEHVDGRAAWYTPWGDPADVRSLAVARDGAIHVNVHVGGVARSRDGGASWTPTVDIEADVHQVLAHPTRPEVVLVAAAEGFGISRDGGDTWQFATAGLHAHYLRAVAVAGDHVVISASAGPHGRRAALYRRRLDDGRFERSAAGLPKWFDDNIDTGCLAAAGPLVVFGTGDGQVFRSLDAGVHWELVLKGLPEIRVVALG
jgi:hypothetical protein